MADLGQVVVMPKGKYDPIMQYNALDMIEHKGSSYIAKQTTVGNEPSETSEYWQLSSRGIEGLANNLTTKESGKYALDASMGELLERKKADRTTQHPVILLATNWTGESAPYTYTIELEEVTADNTITLVPAEDITAEQYTALQSAQIADAEQTAGTLTLQAKNKPAIDIPILVLIGDTSVPSAGGGATIPLVNHLLTENSGVGALDAYQGMILDGKIACLSNPNLLINPDFRINQRGQTEYTSAGYTVDRWRIYENGNITSENGYVLLGAGNGFVQCVESNDFLNGKTVTMSALTNHGFVSGTLKVASEGHEYFTVNDSVQLYHRGNAYGVYPVKETIVYWMKLEIGSLATPFVPPEPAIELLKCQRYYQRIPTNGKQVYRCSDGRLFVNFQFSTEMRTTPNIQGLPITLQMFNVVDNVVLVEKNWYNVHCSNSKGVSFLAIRFSELETTGTGVIGYLDNNADFLEADAEIY
ncbi:hypothetical protein [Velocimicrobium porci]|uniref:Uncharacterized protein n=1 Tax=Velocimicrobium porci TaxID=2606634 RepID=A0A6L5Y158_9FIRM|nr:hypothetical protein [Velocimicrobium porci]MSS64609.1 hypothetical protein [Velocimicrobium porci]